jgi:hypothetical protein
MGDHSKTHRAPRGGKSDDKLEQELVSCTALSLRDESESRVYKRLEIIAELLSGLPRRPLPGQPCLLYQSNDRVELVDVPKKQGWFTVGREKGDLILKEATVSRVHFRLKCQGDGVNVEDCGSKHGTRVNGEKLVRPRRLCDGDLIQAGKQMVVFLLESRDSPPG